MNPKIYNLSNQIRRSKESGDKFVLMLGAGASIASGVKPTTQIMSDLLAQFGAGITGPDLSQRFSQLWRRLSDNQRTEYLSPYLDVPPSRGYEHLANLIRKEYIDTVITFNFDRLLQKAMRTAGLRDEEDFETIVGGDVNDDKVVALMKSPKPRIKILKLHGNLTGATLLWTAREMLNYPPPIRDLVQELTKRPMIICGYGFGDLCVQRAFSDDGAPVYYVSPGGAPTAFAGIMGNRHSEDLQIDGTDGEFDSFFAQLATALEPQPVVTNRLKPVSNPFKYLESYEIADKDCFFGREDEVKDLISKIEQRNAPVICVLGPPKSGKTSLLRAGVMARLDAQHFYTVPLRCRGSLDQTLDSQMPKWLPNGANGESGAGLLKELAASTRQQHAIVVLDQFERVLIQQPKGSAEEALRKLTETAFPNVTVVCVSTDEKDMFKAAIRFPKDVHIWTLENIDSAQIAEIIRRLAERGGVTFASAILDALQDEYKQGIESDQRRFSLAQVQAICHMLFEDGASDLERYRTLLNDERAGLDLAINRCDIINFIEDVPSVEERSLLRDLIRLVSQRQCNEKCNEKIVKYVQDHVSGMWAAIPKAAAAGGS